MTTSWLKNLALALLAGMVLVSFSACRNTADGVGKDIEKAGDKIQDSVN